MSNNNWHVPLNKFSEEQRKVIERVYGGLPFYRSLISFEKGVMTTMHHEGEEITPDEAFKILGLDRLLDIPSDEGIKRYKETIVRLEQQGELVAHELHEAESKIKELEQKLDESKWARSKTERELEEESFRVAQLTVQLKDCKHKLASQPEQGLQGVDWPEWADCIMQNGDELDFVGRKVDKFYRADWTVIATRPKPKAKPLSEEQIKAVREYDKWLDKHANEFEINLCDAFLKEREQ